MAINEAVNIDIDVNGTSTVKQAANAYEDLGDAVSKTQLEAERLAQQFGINDARTQEAIRTAGQYKQQMEELDFAIDGARGGVDQMFRAAQGVAAGFEVAAGAAALFGTESEELEKILIKVQGAMVFSQGLRDIKEFTPAILSAVSATRKWFAALTTLEKSLVGLALGAITSLVYSLQESFDDVAETTRKASEAQEKYNNTLKDLYNEIAQLDETRKETIQRNLDELQKAYQEWNEENTRLNEQRRYQETEEEKAALQEQIDANVLAGVEITAQQKKLQKELEQIEKEERKRQKEQTKKDNEDAQRQRDKEFQDWLANELKKNEAQQANAKYVEEQRRKEAEDNEEAFQAWLEYEVQKAEMAAANAEYVANKKKEADEEEKRSAQAKADLEQELFSQSQDLANAIVSLAGEQSKLGKAVALAAIGADTARALSSALANTQSPTPDNIATGGLAGIGKYLVLATNILTNAKRAYGILKAPAPTGSASPTGGQAPAANQYQASSIRFGEELLTSERRVFVLEGDITRTQNTVNRNRQISVVE